MLKEIYFLIVCGSLFEKAPIEFEEHPTDQQIKEAIVKLGGQSARVEKRFKVV